MGQCVSRDGPGSYAFARHYDAESLASYVSTTRRNSTSSVRTNFPENVLDVNRTFTEECTDWATSHTRSSSRYFPSRNSIRGCIYELEITLLPSYVAKIEPAHTERKIYCTFFIKALRYWKSQEQDQIVENNFLITLLLNLKRNA
ncbi:unnamed protein product [Leptidea sinapis]|uniref:Uncharacterized protein n=1 Tax=Leptidea sinapis TaxID=189913 RepID=A0A5E4QFQ3_9NEOP|nr:unnamed protein product [Leptidea sinapis]